MTTLEKILGRPHPFDGCRVMVVGDLMLDEYLWGHIERISPEAPVPILKVIHSESMLGGAGNVIKNLSGLGVDVISVGVVGQDETGERVRDLVRALGLETVGVIVDAKRKSTRKVRLMSIEHGQQVFRWDEESTERIPTDIEDRLIDFIREQRAETQVILCSDYMKGMLTERVLEMALQRGQGNHNCSIIAPKNPNTPRYHGAHVLMPNMRELSQLVGTPMDGDKWLVDSAQQLAQELALQALVVTRGKEGMTLFERAEGALRRVDVPTAARSVYDVTGAGDTAIATFAAAVASGTNLETAVQLANLAAGIKVGKRGTARVTVDEMRQHLSDGNLHSIAATKG